MMQFGLSCEICWVYFQSKKRFNELCAKHIGHFILTTIIMPKIRTDKRLE